MTPTEFAVRYRGYAAKCLILAQHQDDTSDKLVLIDMAQAWANLADVVDKNEALFALAGVSVPARPEDAR